MGEIYEVVGAFVKGDENAGVPLKAYSWPGDVREVKHIVERAAILSDGEFLRIPELMTS